MLVCSQGWDIYCWWQPVPDNETINETSFLRFLPRCMERRRGLAMRILSVLLSVRLSVWQTRELWQNERKISPDFYAIRNIIYPSFLKKEWLVGWLLLPEIFDQPRFWAPFGDLWAKHTVHFRLIGKLVVDFPFEWILLEIGVFEGSGPVSVKFLRSRGCPPRTIFVRIDVADFLQWSTILDGKRPFCIVEPILGTYW